MAGGFEAQDWIDPKVKRPLEGSLCWVAFVQKYTNAPREIHMDTAYYVRGDFVDVTGQTLALPYRWMKIPVPELPAVKD